MSCPMCAYEFCWICMEAWPSLSFSSLPFSLIHTTNNNNNHNNIEHGTSWYNCQFVDPKLVENQTYLGCFAMFCLKYDDYEKNAKSFASRFILIIIFVIILIVHCYF